MAAARCSTCGKPLSDSVSHCDGCEAVAATVYASGAPTAVAGKRGAAAKGGDPLIAAEVIGQYVIRRLLGKGGMGAVYLADQPSVKRQAVIKVLHPTLSRDPALVARFDVEAQAASQLSHPHIVIVYNYGAMADGTLFLAMEHLDGVTLEEVIGRGRLPIDRAIAITLQVVEALAEAHRKGVIHRDVKPSNVMLVARGQAEDFVKVLDFGIAHVEGSGMTGTGDICGTPRYMSPEQLRGQKLDGRSDLYSLGCILFEMVTGQPPFDAGTPLGLGYLHVHEAAPRASAVAPKAKIPGALDVFLARVLAKEPGDRPKNAEAFAKELRRALEVPTAAVVTDAPQARAPAGAAAAKPQAEASPPPAAAPVPVPAPASPRRPAPPRAAPRGPSSLRRGIQGLLRRASRLAEKVRPRRRPLGERLIARVRALGPGARRRPRWRLFAVLSVLGLALAAVGWVVVTRWRAEGPAVSPSSPAASPTSPRAADKPPRRVTRKQTRF